jgi:hypothetical protein
MVQFTCCECGRHVSVVGPGFDKVPKPPLCAACLMMPGWTSDPLLRERLGCDEETDPMPPHDSVPLPPDCGPLVYADLAGWTCSICAPLAMGAEEVEAFATRELGEPIGGWEAVDKSLMGLGEATPGPCNQAPTDRRHWFLLAGLQAAQLGFKTKK